MTTPDWLDPTAYPFASHTIALSDGQMHYLDEGQGPPLLFVHGTPTWSFLYRHLIRDLSRDYRCIAPDNLGFGLSRGAPGFGYRLADHARALAELIERLGLEELTLVVHDLGGPIGLAYALDHPQQISRLALFNTTLWPFDDDPTAVRAGRLLGGPLGKLLYLRLNFSARVIMPAAMGVRARLTAAAHRQYLAPFARPEQRYPTWMLAREVLDAGPWLAGLWARRAALADIPALLIWGLRDPAFTPRYLERWRAALPAAQVVTLDDVGHFVPEEAPERATPALRAWLAQTPAAQLRPA